MIASAAVQRLNIHHISNLRKIDEQIIINIDFDHGVKRILNAYDITFKVIYSYDPSSRINNPVFTHPIILVVVELSDIIV